jgi:NADH-quinone oxidoreductase subunit N
MALGAFAAIWQVNIKRLMAYSSIGHIGYALVGLAAGNQAGVEAVLIYIAIYVLMNAAAFAVILAMRRDGKAVERIDDLAGLAHTQPVVAAALAIAMFAMAGIPPLSGFFGKLYVFMAAVQAGQYTLAVLGVLASVVGAYYYIRIVKIMYFDEAGVPLDRPMAPSLSVVLAGASLFTLFFFALPSPLVAAAAEAAASLFPAR